ncbi:MAG: hypothetical protein AAFP13_04105 [Pseudomonadota bacterium]
MSRPIHRMEKISDSRPAFAALYDRSRDAEAAYRGLAGAMDGDLRETVVTMAALHSARAEKMREIAGRAVNFDDDKRLDGTIAGWVGVQAAAAEATLTGALPASLKLLEDRVVSAIDKAIIEDHTDPTRGILEDMKLELLAQHETLGFSAG